MSSRMIALIAIVLASLLWSTAGLSKIIVRDFDPFTAGFLRFFVASVVIFPLFLREKNVGKKMFFDLVPVALFLTGNVAFYYIGLKTSTANAAAIIYTAVPLVVALLAPRLIKESVSPTKLVGIMVGLVGVLVIVLLPFIEQGQVVSGEILGNVFFLSAVLVWSLYAIGSRHMINTKQYSPLSVSAISIFTATIIFFPLSLINYQPQYITLLRNPYYLFLFFYLGTAVTVATFVLFQWAIKHSSATTASLNVYIQPFFAVIVNVLFLGEKLTSGFLFGGLLVIAGVFLATSKGMLEELRKVVRI